GSETPIEGDAGRRSLQVFEQIGTTLPTPSVQSWIPRRSKGAPTVFVTGATGFIGSHLVERLIEQGAEVRALIRPTSKLRHLETLDIDWVEGDLRDAKTLAKAMEGCEIVYHCAASTQGPWSESLDWIIQGQRYVLVYV